MSNFGFLAKQKEFALFASAAIEAERVYATSTAMCAIGCRKALELAVKWVRQELRSLIKFLDDGSQPVIYTNLEDEVINYIEANGYIDDVKVLMQLPFDKPVKLLKLFSGPRVKEIMDIVQNIKDNAIA